MIRIGFLGCDSSHTEAYAELMNPPGSLFHGQARVEWLWGMDPAQASEKARIAGIPWVCDSPDEAIRDADLVMVCNRYGDDHFRPAKAAILAGKPVYIDKPLTNSLSEAQELLALAESGKVPVTSFSPVRFAPEVTELCANRGPFSFVKSIGPADTSAIPGERAKSLYFYGIHAVDLALAAARQKTKRVLARKVNNAFHVSIEFLHSSCRAELELAFGMQEYYQLSVQNSAGLVSREVDPYGKFYEATVEFLLKDLARGSTEAAPFWLAVESIKVIHAIELSHQTRDWVDVSAL